MQNSRYFPDGRRYKQKETKMPQCQFVQNGGKKKKIKHRSEKKIKFESNIRQTSRVRNQERRTDSLWH
ncbi:hypothetical protein [Neisseria sicca]|uniref:hypothetical protein n=1 Tax=Neisseria sicca TaxID=490 RepID=UPI00159D727C|nr:hypothetical protein [Neisseria sicca]